MRFASIATIVVAAASAPFIAAASGPQMEAEEFISAVRCTAYESLPHFAGENAQLVRDQALLNSELRRQSEATADRAMAEVDAIVRRAVETDQGLREERTAACAAAGAMVADRSAERGAV